MILYSYRNQAIICWWERKKELEEITKARHRMDGMVLRAGTYRGMFSERKVCLSFESSVAYDGVSGRSQMWRHLTTLQSKTLPPCLQLSSDTRLDVSFNFPSRKVDYFLLRPGRYVLFDE